MGRSLVEPGLVVGSGRRALWIVAVTIRRLEAGRLPIEATVTFGGVRLPAAPEVHRTGPGPGWRVVGKVGPLIGTGDEHSGPRIVERRGAALEAVVEPGQVNRPIVDDPGLTPLEGPNFLRATGPGLLLVPRTDHQILPPFGGRLGAHAAPVEQRPGLVAVEPAGNREGRQRAGGKIGIEILEFLPITVERGVVEEIPVDRQRPTHRRVEGEQRPVVRELPPIENLRVDPVLAEPIEPTQGPSHAESPADVRDLVEIEAPGRGRRQADQVGRLMASRYPLRCAGILRPHAGDLAIGPGLGGAPFDGVVAVVDFLKQKPKGPLGVAGAANILDHNRIPPAGEVLAEALGADPVGPAPIRRADGNHRVFARSGGQPEVGHELGSVPHRDRHGVAPLDLGLGSERPDHHRGQGGDRGQPTQELPHLGRPPITESKRRDGRNRSWKTVCRAT